MSLRRRPRLRSSARLRRAAGARIPPACCRRARRPDRRAFGADRVSAPLLRRRPRALDHRSRRAGRREEAEPEWHLYAFDARFLHGRHIRQHIGALRARDGERAQPPRAHVLRDRHGVGEAELHLARDQRGERGRAALVGHVLDVGAASQLEELRGEVLRGPRAGRGIVERLRLLFRQRDQLLEVLWPAAKPRRPAGSRSPENTETGAKSRSAYGGCR